MANHKRQLNSDVGTGRDADNAAQESDKVSRPIPKGSTGLRLDKWQEEVLKTKGHFLLCTGRQVGKSTIFAKKCAERMVEQKDCKIIVVSLTEDQAQLIIVMILTHLEQYHKDKIAKGTKKPTKGSITLKNGSKVLSRPVGNTGDAVRGFTGDVLIIDEASRMPESMFIAARPVLLTTGGEIWMCSTPFGKTGYFYESFINKNNRFKVFHISSEQVINERPICDTWTKEQSEGAIRMLEEEKKDMSVLSYAQEYLGQFIDDLRQMFSDDLIDKCCVLKRMPYLRDRRYYLGVDVARLGDDSSTFQVFAKIDNDYPNNRRIEHIESITTNKTLTTDTYDKILYLDQLFDFEKNGIGIDAGSGSLGVGILDFLKRSVVKKKIVALNSRATSLRNDDPNRFKLLNEDMYDTLLSLMERSEIRLLDDELVRLSLKSIQYEYIVKQGQPTKIRIFATHHKHSDIVEGMIRGVFLANQKNINTTLTWI